MSEMAVDVNLLRVNHKHFCSLLVSACSAANANPSKLLQYITG